ncbi:hypothetical protein H6P81_013567 [Aristolochia fimbriata]|uniref:Uncharacterized protein n=1 Tax=Aristolochia fimbriata TaxID=158543 RepID=A0AAV7EFG5_ARIFI|nr:hypothetical protein H6P81_013567 [Aristolochia fimbriata]
MARSSCSGLTLICLWRLAPNFTIRFSYSFRGRSSRITVYKTEERERETEEVTIALAERLSPACLRLQCRHVEMSTAKPNPCCRLAFHVSIRRASVLFSLPQKAPCRHFLPLPTSKFFPLPAGGDGVPMRSILSAGWNLGKKVALTGAAISTAPVILPPLMVVSAVGFAFSVPFGLVLAGYVCNQKVMGYLLPVPDMPPEGFETFREDYFGEEEEGEEEYMDTEKDYIGQIDESGRLGDSTLAADVTGTEQQSRVEETIVEDKERRMDDSSRQDNGQLHADIRKEEEEVLVRENGEGIGADEEEIEGFVEAKKREQATVGDERVIEVEESGIGTIPPGGTCPVEKKIQDEDDKVEEEAILRDIPIKDVDKSEEPAMTLEAEDQSSLSRSSEQDVASTGVAVVPDKAPALETKDEESIEVSSDEGLYSEEELWNQINALRTIVGYKGDVHDSFMEELKAFYVFTGVDPPTSPDDTSDLADATEKLRFLKTVIGVR